MDWYLCRKNVAICIIGDDAEPHVIFGPQTYKSMAGGTGWAMGMQVPIEVVSMAMGELVYKI